MEPTEKKWETYQEVSVYLLDQMAEEFGLDRVEGKQKTTGQWSETEWEIDAKGVKEGSELFFIVECRRYTTSKQNQEKLAALAYRILDTGASGGIIVSPLGLQKGARKVAQAENIYSVLLDPNSTTSNYLLQFLNTVRAGITDTFYLTEKVSGTVVDKDGNVVEQREI